MTFIIMRIGLQIQTGVRAIVDYGDEWLDALAIGDNQLFRFATELEPVVEMKYHTNVRGTTTP